MKERKNKKKETKSILNTETNNHISVPKKKKNVSHTENTKEVVTKFKKKKKKTAIKINNTINLILTLNYYAGQSQE